MSRSRRLHLEPLGRRDVPANLTVTYAAASHTLTIVGDDAVNDVTIQGDAADKTHFFLTSTTGDINNVPGPFATKSGVQNINIRMLAGNDTVTFGNTVPIELAGSLSVNGGDGANTLSTTDLTVKKNFAVTNGVHTGGTATTDLANLTVGGGLSIRNGSGDTFTFIHRNTAGTSAVVGNVTVTNGTGQDVFFMGDMNVGGSVAVANGHGDGVTAGRTTIYNFANTAARSVIRGSVTVSYLDGDMSAFDALVDTEVRGNVTLNHGAGRFATYFDGYKTSVPVVIRGNLTITGTGPQTVDIGRQYNKTGLVVGKTFAVTAGVGDDFLSLNNLDVSGATRFNLGAGANQVSIDDSVFGGTFALTTGAGIDTINFDTTAGTTQATTFHGAVTIIEGAGVDTLTLAGTADTGQGLVILSTFTVHHGVEGETITENLSHESFPFGNVVKYLV